MNQKPYITSLSHIELLLLESCIAVRIAAISRGLSETKPDGSPVFSVQQKADFQVERTTAIPLYQEIQAALRLRESM